jgi:hypothetical protein
MSDSHHCYLLLLLQAGPHLPQGQQRRPGRPPLHLPPPQLLLPPHQRQGVALWASSMPPSPTAVSAHPGAPWQQWQRRRPAARLSRTLVALRTEVVQGLLGQHVCAAGCWVWGSWRVAWVWQGSAGGSSTTW